MHTATDPIHLADPRLQYDLWYPTPTDRFGSARASPSFVAFLLITEAVGSSGRSQISLLPSLPSHPQLAAYAIWDPAARSSGPARLALLNLAVRNVTATAAEQEAAAVTVDLSHLVEGIGKGSSAKVKRMTAPGLDSKDSSTATWAGQSYANGVASGKEVIEGLQRGLVTLQGSEGVLVFFS